MSIQLEWDPDKDAINQVKHGLSFETATRAFTDPFALTKVDRVENGEQRWRTIGQVREHLLVVVAHTVREEPGETSDDPAVEVIRIVSARKADHSERQRYERENR